MSKGGQIPTPSAATAHDNGALGPEKPSKKRGTANDCASHCLCWWCSTQAKEHRCIVHPRGHGNPCECHSWLPQTGQPSQPNCSPSSSNLALTSSMCSASLGASFATKAFASAAPPPVPQASDVETVRRMSARRFVNASGSRSANSKTSSRAPTLAGCSLSVSASASRKTSCNTANSGRRNCAMNTARPFQCSIMPWDQSGKLSSANDFHHVSCTCLSPAPSRPSPKAAPRMTALTAPTTRLPTLSGKPSCLHTSRKRFVCAACGRAANPRRSSLVRVRKSNPSKHNTATCGPSGRGLSFRSSKAESTLQMPNTRDRRMACDTSTAPVQPMGMIVKPTQTRTFGSPPSAPWETCFEKVKKGGQADVVRYKLKQLSRSSLSIWYVSSAPSSATLSCPM